MAILWKPAKYRAVGSECLLIGAGPTGLILAQLLKLNGASKVTLAANAGKKMQIARQLDAADEYVDLDRKNAKAQWEQLKKDNPYGFDVVVEATGVESIVNDSWVPFQSKVWRRTDVVPAVSTTSSAVVL